MPDVTPRPDGYPTVSPYLLVHDLHAMQRFLVDVFDAEIIDRLTDDGGTPTHGEVRIGESVVMMGQLQSDKEIGAAMLYVYVDDCDATYRRALAAGATSLMEPADQFYGDRNAGVAGPSGHRWWIATRVEDVDPDELQRRNRERERQRAAAKTGTDQKSGD